MIAPKQANYIIAAACAETYNTVVSVANLHISTSNQGKVEAITRGWRLSIPAGSAGNYRLAQVDDYAKHPRRAFPWKAPVRLELRARASSSGSPGTWGFGLWNDPFGLSLGFGSGQRLPSLPNAAWFFFASPENHLSLRDDLPGNGALTASFRSHPAFLAPLAFASPLLPFIFWQSVSRVFRRWSSKFVQQDTLELSINPSKWHHYSILWEDQEVRFLVDGQELLRSSTSPRAPLGLVLWLDNQYAAWRPDGSLSYGTLSTDSEYWIEVQDIHISS